MYMGNDFEELLGMGEGIYVGQGTGADFAYDGPVIYHEYMHNVAANLGALSAGTLLDAYGTDDAPGALNEGFADYFAASLSENPVMGSYVGPRSGWGDNLRTLEHDLRCPDYLIGEVHQDSKGFAGALWAARALYPQLETVPTSDTNVRVFDRIVYEALAALLPDSNQADAVQAVLDAVKSEPALNDADAAQALTVFSERNIVACERVLPVTTTVPIAKLELMGKGESSPLGGTVFASYAPGPLQLVVAVPSHGGTAELRATLAQSGPSLSVVPDLTGSEPAEPDWDVKFYWRLDQPVAFDYSGSSLINVTATDQDGLLTPTLVPASDGSVDVATTLTLPVGATKLYLAIANYTVENGVLTNVRLGSLTENPAPTPDARAVQNKDDGCAAAGPSVFAALCAATMLCRRRR